MYAQITNLQIPVNRKDEVRQLVEQQYFESLREREGFIEANMLEAIDDESLVQIITFWDNQNMIESARKTGSLQETIQMLTAHIPEIRIMRQGYLVTVHIDNKS